MFNMSTKFAQSRRGGCPALEKSGQYMEGRDVEILPDGKEKVHREGTLNWGTWAVQMTVWCVITVLARLMVTCTMLLFKNPALETVSALCTLAKAYSFQRQARAAAKCASLAVGVIEDTPSEGSSSPRLVPLLALRARLRLVCGEVAHAKDDQLRAAAIVGMIEFLYPEVHNDIEALQSCSTGALGAGSVPEGQDRPR